MKGKILFGFMGGASLAIIGLIIGMNIGGNYDLGFKFLAGSGYEATGYLGAIIGGAVGVLLGVLLDIKISDKKN